VVWCVVGGVAEEDGCGRYVDIENGGAAKTGRECLGAV